MKTTASSLRLCLAAACVLLLAGCEIPGIYPDPKVVQREADAKATGGGCRHALRGLEDCYAMNPKAPRAAVFSGWKEMDQYMRENKIDGVKSTLPSESPPDDKQTASSGKDRGA